MAKKESRPVAILAGKGTFEKYIIKNKNITNNSMSREDALNVIIKNVDHKSIIVSTTGKTSREIFEIREKEVSLIAKIFLLLVQWVIALQLPLASHLAGQSKK